MKAYRDIDTLITPVPVLEGAGVRLKRCFANSHIPRYDPFLLLDNFHSDKPEDYRAGFPWHPHRGIETVTYMLSGTVEHGDSLGNQGAIKGGDLQWMTAGRGIMHQEMPAADPGTDLWGLQLWVNLPAADKMTEPQYRDVKASDIPVARYDEGTIVRIIAGSFQDTEGPVTDLTVEVFYFDIAMEEGRSFDVPVDEKYNSFLFILEGSLTVGDKELAAETGARLSGGSHFKGSSASGCRFLLIGGAPLNEPVAWGGPVVMNTREELEKAFEEIRNGTFIREETG